MFVKFIAFLLLISVIYVLTVFLTPDMADQYGSKDINQKIRSLKDESLRFATGSDNPSSIAEKVVDTGRSFLDETRQTVDNTQKVITEKTEQVKKAADSVEKVYQAVGEAKQDIKSLTNFSGSVNP